MNLPFRGARESAMTTRYVGAFVLPTRRRRMGTANSVGILLANVPSLGPYPIRGPCPWARHIDDMASHTRESGHSGEARQPTTLGHRAHLLPEFAHLGELLHDLFHYRDLRIGAGVDLAPLCAFEAMHV